MKTKLTVLIVGLLGLVVGFLFSSKFGGGPQSPIVLCGMIVFTFVSAAVLYACEKGRYQVPSCYLFLVACTSLIGFVLRW